LLPIERGILETIYFRTINDVNLTQIYVDRYRNEPFLRIYPEGRFPDLRAVARTNFCDIGVQYDAKTGRAVVVAAIDNLRKGAAGMAVQNMNLAMGFSETAGLL
jgi:N-acetyl-gamma-glutamyl-phosphate reductase